MFFERFVGMLPVLGISIAIMMLINQRKNKFIPRITIAGLKDSRKQNLYYALIANQAEETQDNEKCLLYNGQQPFFKMSMEIILLSTEFERWNKEIQNLKHKLYNSIVFIVPTTFENYVETAAYIAKYLSVFAPGITYVVQYNDGEDYTASLKNLLEAALPFKLTNKQFVKADLSKNGWDVNDLYNRLNDLI